VEPEFSGLIRFSVSTPRDSFGKKLIHIEDHVYPYPPIPFVIKRDLAGNRWLKMETPQAETGSVVKFDFYFIYQVDTEKILGHALALVPPGEASKLRPGSPASAYLAPSLIIDSASPLVKSVAAKIFGGEKAPRRLYKRLVEYIRKHIKYNQAKKDQFFGGKSVYHNMAEMYQHPEITLRRKLGACPDTSVLEAALLRAAGVPTRTAGRWGHFYTEVFLPGKGWLSTSVTPTGIPLVVDPDNRHRTLVSWDPPIALQITMWSASERVEEVQHDVQ